MLELLPCRVSRLAAPLPDIDREGHFYSAYNPGVAVAPGDTLLVTFRVSTSHRCPFAKRTRKAFSLETGRVQRAVLDGRTLSCTPSSAAANVSVSPPPELLQRVGVRACPGRDGNVTLEDARLFSWGGELLMHQQVKDCARWVTRTVLARVDPRTLLPASSPPPLLQVIRDTP